MNLIFLSCKIYKMLYIVIRIVIIVIVIELVLKLPYTFFKNEPKWMEKSSWAEKSLIG